MSTIIIITSPPPKRQQASQMGPIQVELQPSEGESSADLLRRAADLLDEEDS